MISNWPDPAGTDDVGTLRTWDQTARGGRDMVRRFDTGAGRPDGRVPAAQRPQTQSSDTPVEHTSGGAGLTNAPEPDRAVPAGQLREPPDRCTPSTSDESARRTVPRGWPPAQVDALWSFFQQRLPPLFVMAGGAEGGVSTSTVTALLGEVVAAASPGTTVLVDQTGATWNTFVRRLLGGDQGALPAPQAVNMLALGASAEQVIGLAPRTSAGAALVEDPAGYTPLREIARLARSPNDTLVVDGGRLDRFFTARLDVKPVVIVVGRADVTGAEAVCAALALLRETNQPSPVVVLSSNTSSSSAAARRRRQAATKLVMAAGITHLVHLPHDARLASGQPLRLDQVSKHTATAAMRLLTRVINAQGEIHAHRRPAPPDPDAGQSPA